MTLDTSNQQDYKPGTVISAQANFYQVRLDSGDTLLCVRPTRLKKIGQSVLVGDRVLVKASDSERGAIAEVLPRTTVLERPPMANAQQVFLVFSLQDPPLEPIQLSRFLVKAESTRLNLLLGLNKIDLVDEAEIEKWQQTLHSWGYSPYFFSVSHNIGIEPLLEALKGKITILAGPSGVGKSSLISLLIPQVKVRIGAVSPKLHRGRHTTRHVELFQLPQGGFIADSPGFNQPQLDIPPQSLIHCFPEGRMRLAEKSCKFQDCLHRNEPGCVVRGDWERYPYYLLFLTEAIEYQQQLQRRGEEETTVKVKVKAKGKQYTEPKLALKKYRRPSRKVSHQEVLTSLEEEIETDENSY